MSPADDLLSLLTCPGCSGRSWDSRVAGADDLPRLDGLLCCHRCGLALSAREGVVDLDPAVPEPRRVNGGIEAVARRLAHLDRGSLFSLLPAWPSSVGRDDGLPWIDGHAPRGQVDRVADVGCRRGRLLRL